MKIAFVGSHGTGKSTLLEILQNRPELIGHRVYDGIGRAVHTGSKEKWSLKRKQRYFNRYYVWRHYWSKNFIASRSIYDTFGYSKLMVGLWFNYRLMNWAIRHIHYDYLFYLPIEFPLEEDGVRYGRELQEQHDNETRLILDYHHIPYHTLTGTVQDRVDQLAGILGFDSFKSLDKIPDEQIVSNLLTQIEYGSEVYKEKKR